jgi:transposase
MSKARLVLTALFVDHQTPTEVAARHGVHRAWVYQLKARYQAEGEAAFEPRSRRPKTSPRAVEASVVELILELREKLTGAGQHAERDLAVGLHPLPTHPSRRHSRRRGGDHQLA